MREPTSHNLKMAKFKKIDWTTIEEKLMKGPNTIKVGGSGRKSNNHFRNRRGQSHDLGRNDGAGTTKLFGGGPGQIDWASYLPRLRKDLAGINPKESVGSIWPQK